MSLPSRVGRTPLGELYRSPLGVLGFGETTPVYTYQNWGGTYIRNWYGRGTSWPTIITQGVASYSGMIGKQASGSTFYRRRNGTYPVATVPANTFTAVSLFVDIASIDTALETFDYLRCYCTSNDLATAANWSSSLTYLGAVARGNIQASGTPTEIPLDLTTMRGFSGTGKSYILATDKEFDGTGSNPASTGKNSTATPVSSSTEDWVLRFTW